MGARHQGGAPTYRPGSVFFWAGILLCCTFGITAAAIHESVTAEDWIWFWIFVGGESGCLVLYFWIVRSWLRWMDQTGDFSDAPNSVDFPCDHDHTGEV